jgi:hypothetical protein
MHTRSNRVALGTIRSLTLARAADDSSFPFVTE